jgi:uncharacterized protein YbaA (DUF1428 family)
MADYVEVIVVPVPTEAREKYRAEAEKFAAVWRDAGALSSIVVEADDAPPGKLTSFPQSVDLKPGETIFLDIITYRSRTHRDEVKAKAMADKRMADMDPKSMPFDMKRMFWGGFKPFVAA